MENKDIKMQTYLYKIHYSLKRLCQNAQKSARRLYFKYKTDFDFIEQNIVALVLEGLMLNLGFSLLGIGINPLNILALGCMKWQMFSAFDHIVSKIKG